MKKIVASVGIVALGVSGAVAASAPGLSSMDTSKAWSVTGSLRGFYDDNYLCLPSSEDRDSFGFEVSPSVRVNLPMDQTYLGARYIYSGRYFSDRDRDVAGADADPWDHSHQFDLILNHAFSERYSLSAQDTFVIAQEAEVLSTGADGVVVITRRQGGNNIRNTGQLNFRAELTRQLGLEFGYRNSIWDYEEDGAVFSWPFDVRPSVSGLMDRMEHAATLNLRWVVQPETTAVVGYTYGRTDYSSSEIVGWLPTTGFMRAKIRDLQSHSFFVGGDHNFQRNVTGSIRAGATYVDYRYDETNDDNWMPYANAQLSFGYAPGSDVRLGVVHTYNSTDVFAPSATDGTVTSSQHSTSVYGALNHRITAKLLGSASATYQHSTFAGGMTDGDTEDFLMLGLNLTYAINAHFSAEVGYNFDTVSSGVRMRDFDRNRLYLGVTAHY